jgi:dipeptidyl aminopeptidase/acylaminoacyl peptidase
MENNKDDNGTNDNGTNDNGTDNNGTDNNGRDKDNKKKLAVADEKDVSGNITSSNDPGDKSGFEVGRKKNGSAKIDYATTIEDAYDDLNQILGSDGIKNLTDDTQRLMKQQMELAKSMEAMTPLVQQMLPMAEKAKDMMASMDNNNGDMSGLLAMAQKMSGNLGGAKKKQ